MVLRRLRGRDAGSSNQSQSVELDMSIVSRDSTRRTNQSKSTKGVSFGFGSKPRDVELAIKEGTNEDESEGDSRSSSYGLSLLISNRALVLSLLVGTLGLLASTFFLGFGVSGAVREQEGLFNLRAAEAATELQTAWREYEAACRWLFQASSVQNLTHEQFADVYEYVSYEHEVLVAQWVTRSPHERRTEVEDESKQYLAEYFPDFAYHGITGLEPDPDSPTGESVQNRSVQSFYYPIHFFEPLEENLVLTDFDLYSSSNQREAIEIVLDTYMPAVSKPFYPRTLNSSATEQLIMLLHPGLPLSSKPDAEPRDIAALLVEIKALIRLIALNLPQSLNLYLYDSTEGRKDPAFLLGAEVIVESLGDSNITYLDFVEYGELINETVVFLADFRVPIAQNAEWTMVVVAVEETFEPNVLFIIVVGKFTLLISLSIALWIFYNIRRTRILQDVRRRADAEKAAMIVKSARETAKVEQDLNDYIAHEVRNPLAAAMSACSFVKASVSEKQPLKDAASIVSVREDVDIIESSLNFMNDLLRSMLDMHRAASKKLQISFVPVDVRKDILQPVASMLYGRDMNYEVIIDCAAGLEVLTDRLRLKQVILNLGRNATKFVDRGFVKLGATIVEGNVRLFVADSGFGISQEKRKSLFSKFQESLDVMNQGTGMGLCLCKNMVELLSGDIWLDEEYDSGIEGYPGTCFIIDLKMPPIAADVYEEFIPDSYNAPKLSSVQESPVRTSPANKTNMAGIISASRSQDEADEPKSAPAPLFQLSAPPSTTPAATPTPLFAMSAPAAKPAPLFATSAPPASPAPLFSISPTPAPASTTTSRMQSAPVVANGSPTSQDSKIADELPKNLSILFVDDDLVLRKLFIRSVRKAVSGWTIKDAANGETCIRMVESESFDIIFVDQYMASVQKQLLGTETTRALRSKGVTSRICGLSANDVEQEFLRSGADFFMFKPFPCKPDELRKELHRILFSKRLNPEYDKVSPTQEHSDSTSQLTQSTAGDENKEVVKPPTATEQNGV